MGSDFNVKPVGAPVSPSRNSAVATELPASRSVTAADPIARVPDSTYTAGDDLSHQAFFDRAADSIVYQAIDNRTSLVVQQYPEQTVLRRRAYFRALNLAKSAPTRPLATDRMV